MGHQNWGACVAAVAGQYKGGRGHRGVINSERAPPYTPGDCKRSADSGAAAARRSTRLLLLVSLFLFLAVIVLAAAAVAAAPVPHCLIKWTYPARCTTAPFPRLLAISTPFPLPFSSLTSFSYFAPSAASHPSAVSVATTTVAAAIAATVAAHPSTANLPSATAASAPLSSANS